MKYEVWLNFRHPKTLEQVAAVRVYAHEDRLRAERVLENAQADFAPLVLAILQVQPGALVNAEMRRPIDGYEVADRAYAEYGILAEDFEVVNFARWCAENATSILRGEQ